MSLRAWFRPPRHLLPLFLLITLVPSTLLVVFGWRSLEQDQALALRQSEQRTEQAADLVVSALDQNLASAEQSLGDASTLAGFSAPGDAVAVIFTPSQVEAFPEGRMAYYPVAIPGREAPPQTFTDAEELENARLNYAAASDAFRELARSPDQAVRAGALIGLARNQRKLGEPDAALTAYADAAELKDVAVTGMPASLLARWARCGLLEELGRTDELQAEAATLYSELLSGRWSLDRSTYELNLGDARRWMGDASEPTSRTPDSSLSEAIAWLWNEWRTGRSPNRETAVVGGVPFTVISQGGPDRLAALVAGPDYAETNWIGGLDALSESQQVRVTLQEDAASDDGTLRVRRTAAETGLPWTLQVTSTGQAAELERLAGRRRLWLAGLLILAALVTGGTYFIARAVSRELAVARLQSDFVSSVSHEFRTPLTSLGQLTEILLDRRIESEERRYTYYQALARQTERLRRLVESLLDFGRMEAGTSPYRLELLDACALIRSVVEQFEPEAARLGYHVELENAGAAPAIAAATISADPDALSNVLWNLLDNAVKYSRECRTVWVHVERAPGRLAIRVRDRGIGIPPAEQKDIFRKFIRGGMAKAEGIQGTGIGLAMVQHIVKAHGGEVRVESQPGEGSTFTVLLPMEESCPAS